jgi:enoyl-CoA hydratase/carnithine racemase
MLERLEHGPVHELRLARPPVNALSPELITGLADAVEAAPAAGARALVLSGRPGMFSAGLDVPVLLALDRPAMGRVLHQFFRLLRAIAASPVPMAAAVTGHSPAGGAVLALFCDYRVMAEGDFRIGLNEVQVGIELPPPILVALRHAVGLRQAERLAVGGLMVSAAEARAIGLVDELAPVNEVVEHAVDWCRGLLALPRGAMNGTRTQCRAELIAEVERQSSGADDRFLASWFCAETQQTLRALVERLRKKE